MVFLWRYYFYWKPPFSAPSELFSWPQPPPPALQGPPCPLPARPSWPPGLPVPCQPSFMTEALLRLSSWCPLRKPSQSSSHSTHGFLFSVFFFPTSTAFSWGKQAPRGSRGTWRCVPASSTSLLYRFIFSSLCVFFCRQLEKRSLNISRGGRT